MDDHCIVISDSEDELEVCLSTESDNDIDSISLAGDDESHEDDVGRDLPSTSNGRVTGSGCTCRKGHIAIKQEYTLLAGKDSGFSAVDSESEVQAEEQLSGIGEKNSELDGDYNAEGQSRNQTHQNKLGNISGDVSVASESKGNGMTLEDLWIESQSYSQVEPVEYKFENRPWDLADFSSPGAVQSRESQLPRVSSPGLASSVPSLKSPLPQVSSPGLARNQTHQNEPGNISGDVSYANDSKCNTMTLGDLWMESQSYSQVEPVEYEFENRPWDLADFSSPGAVQSRELPRVSSPRLASSVPSRESLLPQVSPSVVVRSSDHEGSDAVNSGLHRPDSTNEDCLQQGRGPEQSGNEDTLPHKVPTPMLNEGSESEEEPMDTASDEDVHKLRRSLVNRKAPVVSKSETDSDETCIEDNDLDPSSSQAGSVNSEPPSSDETMIDSNDGDYRGCAENMNSHAVDEVVVNETTEGFDTQPFSPILDAVDKGVINETTQGFDTQPFSPVLDAVDKVVINESTEDFDTQPFSPILYDETEDSLSDASEDFLTSETIVPRDSLSHLLEDKEHDGREAAALEPKDLFSSDPRISCQCPDEEIHQPQRNDAGSETSSSRRSNGVNPPCLQREDESPGQYFPTDSQLSIGLNNEDTEELTTQQLQQKPLEDDSQGQYFPTDSQLSISLDNEDTEELTTQQLQQKPLEDDSQGQYFPTDSQLSISLDNEDTEELTTQQLQQKPLEDDSQGQYFPTDSQLSISLDNEDTEELTTQQRQLNNNSGKKILPCQRNAWSSSELQPQDRFLLLQEGESEPVSTFLQETLAMPSSPSVAPSTSTAAPGSLVASRNEQLVPKKNKSFRRPSRSEKLLSTMKQSDQQKEKNPTKMTNSLQDTLSNPPSLSSKESSETPSASMSHSVQDCLQQPESSNSNEMGLEDKIPALSHGHLSVQSMSFPTRSSYSANISESSATLIGGHATHSGTSETPNTKPDRVKPTGDDRSACPSDPPNPSLVVSDIRKPPKKRRHSQTSSVPSGNQGTKPSKVTRDSPQQPASSNSNEMVLEGKMPADPRNLSHGHSSVPRASFPSTSSYSANISESSATLIVRHAASSGTSETPNTKPQLVKPTRADRSICPSDPPNPSLVASDIGKPIEKRRHSHTSSVPSGNRGTEPSKVTRDSPQQPASSNSNEMGLEGKMPAYPRNLSHGHSSVPRASFPSTSSYSANISESSATLIVRHAASSGTSETPNTKPQLVKPTRADGSICPSDPPNPSLVASDIGKPIEKRRHSHTSSVPSGNRGTEPSKVTRDSPQQPASSNSNEMGLEGKMPAYPRNLSHGHSSVPRASFPSTSSYSANISESSATLIVRHAASSGTSETPNTKPQLVKPTRADRSICPSDPPNPSLVASDIGKPIEKRRHSHTSSVPSGNRGTEPSKVTRDSPLQPASSNSNEMGLEGKMPAYPRNLSHGHSSVPRVSFPSTSSYSANISESSATLIVRHAASSGTSETPNTKPQLVKPTRADRSICPSDPPNPSLVASDIGKPIEKRRHSQTSSTLSGYRGTEPSKFNRITKELKKENVLSCVLSWNADWFDKHKEVNSAEILQSFLMGKEVPKYHVYYPDVRSYQEAFICFLLLEMWSNVSSSVAKDCGRTWRQNSRENKISQDIVEVQYEAQYEAADIPTEPQDLSVGDLVLVDMTADTASEKQFNFGLVQGIGLSDRTICLALHKSIIVPSSTRLKVVKSLSHYLNQIRALLSFKSHPLTRHIIKPEDFSVFVKDTQVNAEGRASNDELLNSYMESITSTASQMEVIRLMLGAAGTGKTAFLCRLVRRIARVHKKIPKTLKNPYKLLVCAPTNQSLDVLLRKIWDALKDNKRDNAPTGCRREAMKHIIDGVEIVRVGKAEEADRRLTDFLLSTVMASKRKQGSPYDELSEDGLQTKILQQADIVGCTLEDCGLEIVRSSLAGNVFALIVDDASHCLETEILLALQCKTKRVFLAGDQEQGIVSICSKEARALDFGRSMLDRLAENFEREDRHIHRWEVQHRMKEDIAKYPSSVMYHRLKTRNNHPPFFLRPYIIFDVADGKESLHRDSVVNTSEVSFIEVLVSGFLKQRERFTLGIIAPSEGQKGKLLERLQGKNIPGLLVGTPTNFYGLEKDVIILCCTSTSRTPNENGFVMNKQVLNLALTRSKLSLIIVGNMRSLQKMCSNWKSLVDDATGRQLVFRTSQASYSKDAKECHSKDPKDCYSLNVKNCHKETVPSKPSASCSHPEMPPIMVLPSRTVSEGRTPPVQQQEQGGGQDITSRRSEDSFRNRHNPGPQGSGLDPMEADAVMPEGANCLPPGVDPGSKSSQALSNEGNGPMFVGEQHVPYAPRDISQSQPFRAIQASCNGVEENRPSRHKHVSGDAGIDNGSKRRVHFDAETEDHGRASKVMRSRSCNSVQGDSSSSGRPFGVSSHSFPSFRDSAQPQSKLKKPDRSIASTSYGEDRGVIGHQVHHNLMSHSRSIASTAPGISASSNSTYSPRRQRRRNGSALDASLDTEDGKSLHVIATGMSDNERLPRQQKGQNIAGHIVGKRKPQSSRKRETIEHDRRERRPSGEATGAGTSQHRNRSNGNETGQNQSRDHQRWQNKSDQRPQHQYHRQQVSSGRHELDRSERRPSGEATGAGTSQRRNGSNGNEMGHNQSRDHQQQQNRSDRRPQHQGRQQPQPYPGRRVQRIAYNRTGNEAYGGHSTALTEPLPNIRWRKCSNSVKERQMYYPY